VGLDALALVATQPFTPRALTDLSVRAFGGLFNSRPRDRY